MKVLIPGRLQIMFKTKTKPKLLLIPKIISIIYILVLIFLSLDSFKTDIPLLHQMIRFLIYMVPVFLLLLFLYISYKHPSFGGALYIISSLLMILFWDSFREISGFLAAPLPLMIIGLQFIIFGIIEKK